MVRRCMPNSDGGPPGSRVMTILGSYVDRRFPNIQYFHLYGGIWRYINLFEGIWKYMEVYEGIQAYINSLFQHCFFSRIFEGLDAFEVRLRCVWGAFEMRLMCVWVAFEVRLRSVWGAFEVCLRCVWNAFEVRLRCVQGTAGRSRTPDTEIKLPEL